MEQGEFDRAERMFRSLMLVVGRDEDPEAPSKAEALLSLSELSVRRGDEARAQELIESAFEASSESGREALALEAALRNRGRHDLLARALHSRLDQVLSPAEAATALADLVVLHAEHLGGRFAQVIVDAAEGGPRLVTTRVRAVVEQALNHLRSLAENTAIRLQAAQMLGVENDQIGQGGGGFGRRQHLVQAAVQRAG
jgi:hypothetical protein